MMQQPSLFAVRISFIVQYHEDKNITKQHTYTTSNDSTILCIRGRIDRGVQNAP